MQWHRVNINKKLFNRFMDIENRFIVAGGERGSRMDCALELVDADYYF